MKTVFLCASWFFFASTEAYWRNACSRLVLDQIDPVGSFDQLPGSNIYAISGGNDFTYRATGDDLKQSTCTSCSVKGDNSAYWTPALYFQDGSTGLFELVNQVYTTIYYIPKPSYDVRDIKPFPPNFRMMAGDPRLRSGFDEINATEANRRQRAIGFNCLNYGEPAHGFLENLVFPDRTDLENCKDGLRAEIAFPNCWDGVNPDSLDHRSHVAYPEDVQDGACPSSHPTRILSILSEVIWDVVRYNGRAGRFVWSNADPTGYGYHGYFMPAWEDGLLERTMADLSCTEDQPDGVDGRLQTCQTLVNENRIQTSSQTQQCTISQVVPGNFQGKLESLPGCPVVESGPNYAQGCTGNQQPRSDSSPIPGPPSWNS